MGRAFEYRKATKMKRWGNMARVFTKLGKQITVATKNGGPDPDTNPRLRILMQQVKKENMPKENVERAIKKAISKDEADYKEVMYEGYGSFGIAIVVETTTDNTNRTVASIRSYFSKYGGSLGTSGSLEFMFDHVCIFKIAAKTTVSLEELELELIDFGVEELEQDGDEIIIYGDFKSNSDIQKYLEDNDFEIHNVEFVRLPKELKELTTEQQEQIRKLLDKLDEDEDVQNVFHNMKEDSEE